MYIANLAIAGIIQTIFCVPPTVLLILYGGWWHAGMAACKMVPTIQGKILQLLHPYSSLVYARAGSCVLRKL